ncbi:Inosine-uridine preferring nucleoside hydrolase [Musa troglodytarum]|uniref:Inosine-uridine preferring nucleoside hydrolase n=1 Tax=Musa troglodytarum TaxID=320322 RepID=A0A9E7E8W5_9LILI|nr:Inosine-uridine preferring nucleoside hydrolase [Musa troglodytarum]
MESNSIDGYLENNGNHAPFDGPLKVIIDTEPGIGLTTIFGNVSTEDATRNALLLCEIAGHPEVPVAEGSHERLKGGKPRVADFVHGSDGLGNIFLPPRLGKQIEKTASEFLVEKVSQYPGDVCILALGPLTNLALAIKRDSSFANKVKKVVVLGGTLFAAGNVNPAAEANIYGDPEAADVVFTCGADVVVVGINGTTQVKLTDADLSELRNSKGKHSQILYDMCKFYLDWHVKSDGVYVMSYLMQVFSHMILWSPSNPWTGYSPVSVAWAVDAPGVLSFIKQLLMKP